MCWSEQMNTRFGRVAAAAADPAPESKAPANSRRLRGDEGMMNRTLSHLREVAAFDLFQSFQIVGDAGGAIDDVAVLGPAILIPGARLEHVVVFLAPFGQAVAIMRQGGGLRPIGGEVLHLERIGLVVEE